MFNGVWKSDPANYSRMDYFKIDGENAEFIFGYGQTIYFHGHAILEYLNGNFISIQYLKLSGVAVKDLKVPIIVKVHFEYAEGSGEISQTIVKDTVYYDRVLRLNVDPFPQSCDIPYSRETVYYRRSVV